MANYSSKWFFAEQNFYTPTSLIFSVTLGDFRALPQALLIISKLGPRDFHLYSNYVGMPNICTNVDYLKQKRFFLLYVPKFAT